MAAHWPMDGRREPWFPAPMERPFGRGINLQFMIDDVEGRYARVMAQGVTPFLALLRAEIRRTDRMDARAQLIVLDPDGYALRFAQVVSHRPLAPSELAAPDAGAGEGAAEGAGEGG